MNTSFSHFCIASPAALDILRRSIDTWDRLGKSYEFPNCLMPPNCSPQYAALGFARRGDGYLLYWKPAVAYSGPSPVLAALFSRSVWTFPSFAALSSRLASLHQEMQAAPGAAPGKVLRAAPFPPEKRRLFQRRVEDGGGEWPPLFQKLEETLSKTVLGQPSAVQAAAFRLYSHVGKPAPARPLSLIFYGPTGAGKSELGKAIGPALQLCCGQPWQFVWTELNTFTQPHSVHRLTGAPPGYVGYEDAPIFESVRLNPLTVFMFDELEKAHPEVLKVFMSILDEGRCSARRAGPDGLRELDFRRCVFVFTTNAPLQGGSQRRPGFASERTADPEPPAAPASTPAELAARLFQENEKARRAMIRLGVLPEIAGRFTGLIGFRALDQAARLAVTAKQISSLGREYGLRLQTDPETVQALVPGEDALSVRSFTSVLEGLLTPLLLQAAASGRTAFRLSGLPGSLRLTPAYCSAS